MFDSSPGPWPFGPMVILMMTVAVALPFWFIFSKAGYSRFLGLLMVIPLVNIILLYFLAFSRWPGLERMSHQS